MATAQEILENNDPSALQNIVYEQGRMIAELQQKFIEIQSLSEISGDMGDVTRGRFISPSDTATSEEPTDTGFTGAFQAGIGLLFSNIPTMLFNAGAAAAGLLQAGYNTLGQFVAGAGAILLHAAGMEILSREYPTVSSIIWKAEDTGAETSGIYGTYVVGSTAGFYIYSRAKTAGETSGIVLDVRDENGVSKGNLSIFTNGFAQLNMKDASADTAGSQAFYIANKIRAADNNIPNTALYLQSSSKGTPVAGFGTKQVLQAQNGSGNIKDIGSIDAKYIDVTNGSEDSELNLMVMVNGTMTKVATFDGNQLTLPFALNLYGADTVDKTAFTPVVIGTTTAGTGTYTTQLGFYARWANMVFIQIFLAWTAHTGTGNMRISGLPITAANNGMNVPLAISWNNITLLAAANKILPEVLPNTTVILLSEIGSGALSALPMDTAGTIKLSGFYFV